MQGRVVGVNDDDSVLGRWTGAEGAKHLPLSLSEELKSEVPGDTDSLLCFLRLSLCPCFLCLLLFSCLSFLSFLLPMSG